MFPVSIQTYLGHIHSTRNSLLTPNKTIVSLIAPNIAHVLPCISVKQVFGPSNHRTCLFLQAHTFPLPRPAAKSVCKTRCIFCSIVNKDYVRKHDHWYGKCPTGYFMFSFCKFVSDYYVG